MQRDDQGALDIAERYYAERVRPPLSVVADPHVQRTASGLHVVYFHFHYRGVPLFLESAIARVDMENGGVTSSGGEEIDLPPIDIVPDLSPAGAVVAAGDHLIANGLADKPPRRARRRIVAAFATPSRPTVLTGGHFGTPVTAQLAIEGAGLVWVVRIRTRDGEEYVVLVRAGREDSGEITFCEPVSSHACTASIFVFSPTDGARATVTMPRSLADYPPQLHGRAGLLRFDWIENNIATGNNVETFFNNARVKIRALNSIFPAPANATNREQCVLNAFFFCNFMHDFFALLGFSEAEGNFQLRNHFAPRGANDRLRLKVSSRPFVNVGQMDARHDGEIAEMFLGVHPSTGRAAALDGDIVIHEYTHGVTQRLIGGRQNADALILKQSRALGEGWSDFFAVTIRNYYRARDNRAPNFIFAEYCSNGTLRSQPYDENHTVSIARLGRAPHDSDTGAGEIWAAALIDFARRLVSATGEDTGYPLAWQVVFESFAHVPSANPTFIQARDAVFDATAHLSAGAFVLAAAREAFRIRGMGGNAVGGVPRSFEGVRADTTAF